MAYLEIENLHAFYGKAQALTDVSLSVNKAEIIAIIGANGAGKSTLLDSVMGLTKTRGRISLEGRDLHDKSSAHIVRQGVGYAPERFNLFPYMTVEDNLLVGAYTSRDNIAENMARVNSLFPRLAERRHQETSTQSGGERQMVSLGRALMTSPSLLLVDEPTIGLAPKVCLEIAQVLRRMRDEFGTTIVITEQNANFALTLAERLYVLESGKIRAEGTAQDLSENMDFMAAYFGH
jgi:branched-chain amino acid transport system ATP-binding protein